jgi:outer membrane protein assembly factor BamB
MQASKFCVIIVSIFLLCSMLSSTSTVFAVSGNAQYVFGNSHVGVYSDFGTTGVKRAVLYQLTDNNAELSSILWYGHVDKSASVKCAIYSDNNGPYLLLGQTQSVTVGTVDSWVTFPLSSLVVLQSGRYWLSFVVNRPDASNVYFYYDSGAPSQRARSAVYPFDQEPTTTFANVFAYDNEAVSIYASYTISNAQTTFGKTNIGSNADIGSTGVKRTIMYYLSDNDASVSSIVWYGHVDNAAAMKCAIYSDNNGVPNLLLAQTQSVTVGTVDSWVTFPLNSLVVLQSGRYWLSFVVNRPDGANVYFYYDTGTPSQRARSAVYPFDQEPTTTFENVFAYDNEAVSIYANYKTGNDWPMFHHDPSLSGVSTSAAPQINQTLWIFSGSASENFASSSPAISNGLVFIGSSVKETIGTVYALNSTTGSMVWSFKADFGVFTSPSVTNGIVYVSSEDTLYALNASTGNQIWSTQRADTSPVVADGIVYVDGGDGNFNALNASTGSLIWSYPISEFSLAATAPAVANGIVYVGALNDHNVYALNAATGSKIWSFPTGSLIISSPVVVNDLLYISSQNNYFYALNATTGSQLWNYKTAGPIDSSPAVANGIVYVGIDSQGGGTNYPGVFYALNGLTGSVIWTNQLTFNQQSVYDSFSSPSFASSTIYVGCRSVVSSQGVVFSLNAATGDIIWSYQTVSLESSPAIANGVVYISDLNNIYAFGSPSNK